MSTPPPAAKFIAVVLLAITAFASGLYLARPRTEGPAIDGLLWPDPPQLTAFQLIDMSGLPLTEQALTGKWTVLFFGFTHCPDICPTTLKTMHVMREQLQATPFRATGQVLFVSVDPARDTPAQLREYVQYFDPQFLAATGTDDGLKQFARQIGIVYTKVRTADPAVYSMDHTAAIFLVCPTLQMVGVFSPPYTAENLAGRIRAIIDFVGTPG